MVLFSCMPRGNDIKTKDGCGLCCQNAKYAPLYVSHCKKKKSLCISLVCLLSSPFHQMCVKCRYKALILARKINQAIHHQLTFKFIFLQAFFLLKTWTETRASGRIKSSAAWLEFSLTTYETSSKSEGKKRHAKYARPKKRAACLRHSLSACQLSVSSNAHTNLH